jgi:hypothetical protein
MWGLGHIHSSTGSPIASAAASSQLRCEEASPLPASARLALDKAFFINDLFYKEATKSLFRGKLEQNKGKLWKALGHPRNGAPAAGVISLSMRRGRW